jgi:hypothetical protein
MTAFPVYILPHKSLNRLVREAFGFRFEFLRTDHGRRAGPGVRVEYVIDRTDVPRPERYTGDVPLLLAALVRAGELPGAGVYIVHTGDTAAPAGDVGRKTEAPAVRSHRLGKVGAA